MLHLLPKIFAAIGALLGAMSCYYTVYAIVGLFATRRFAPARRQHRYAIVITHRAFISSDVLSVKARFFGTMNVGPSYCSVPRTKKLKQS